MDIRWVLSACMPWSFSSSKNQAQKLIDMDKNAGLRNDQVCWLMQGSNADYRGHVLGVIGDQNVALSKVRIFAFWSLPQT